uniref:Cadherin domain-containing protein n=1 Tax=Pundamilia nyererei TaxID=303518 RepID=A0A3B4EWQ0_9CICH
MHLLVYANKPQEHYTLSSILYLLFSITYVNVVDINDNVPHFPENLQYLNIAESTVPGGKFGFIGASDLDVGKNDVSSYKLSQNDYFSLEVHKGRDSVSAELVLQKALDRETQPTVNLTVTAVDSGNPPKSGTLQIIINVLDNNDNAPVFSSALYKTQIHENLPMGKTIIFLNATDADDGLNAETEYSFRSKGQDHVLNVFQIDSKTGAISIKEAVINDPLKLYRLEINIKDINDNAPVFSEKLQSLDVPENTLPGVKFGLIEASDLDVGKNGVNTYKLSNNDYFTLDIHKGEDNGGNPPKSGTSLIIISVMDTNDNHPVFSKSLYKIKIPENLSSGSTVITLNATDTDEGSNSEIEYSLRKKGQDHILDLFEINSKTGVISVKGKSVITLTLTAIDGGTPAKSGSMTIIVNVLDVNDNPPVFSQRLYKARVYENVKIGTPIITLNATDLDEGQNGKVIYSFSEVGQGKQTNSFVIDEKTGTVTNKRNIDYEESNAFELRVQASDGASSPLTSHAKLLIEVLDVNDNAPEISLTSLLNTVKEDASVETAIALVSIFDKDGGKNGMVTCKISNNVPFKLESNYKNSYSLVVDGPLDRETAPQYNISITATDEGSPPLSSTSVITVHVSDVNDNKPQFSESVINIYVKENSPVGAVIKKVTAADADIDQNSQVSYSFLQSSSDSVPFSTLLNINSETGDIISLHSFNYEELKTFQFKVQATDSGVPPSHAKLLVWVHCDSHPSGLKIGGICTTFVRIFYRNFKFECMPCCAERNYAFIVSQLVWAALLLRLRGSKLGNSCWKYCQGFTFKHTGFGDPYVQDCWRI